MDLAKHEIGLLMMNPSRRGSKEFPPMVDEVCDVRSGHYPPLAKPMVQNGCPSLLERQKSVLLHQLS